MAIQKMYRLMLVNIQLMEHMILLLTVLLMISSQRLIGLIVTSLNLLKHFVTEMLLVMLGSLLAMLKLLA